MKKIPYTVLIALLMAAHVYAQRPIKVATDTSRRIEEVTVTLQTDRKLETNMKKGASVDEFLASSEQISFIKRGAYAWEPLLNNMGMERSAVTIDGMHIFGACTDKMDPITSYVESNNLSGITIVSGQEGSQHGSTVAGSIDLNRKRTQFGRDKSWRGSYQSGFEFNNKQFFNLGNISYSSDRFAADGSIGFRDAGNYSDGNGNEVNHSQFTKFNTSVALAYKTSPLSSINVDAIFDRASNVGFPALPMDLWLSRALITSAAYKQLFEDGIIKMWDTKVYYNAIEHYMDDTNRPENLVHMDMPGWSTTYGLTSRTALAKGRYSSELQLNIYDNLSIAEMTMYPQDRSNKTMFAYTWPWVTSRFAGLSMTNSWEMSSSSQLNFGGSLGLNYNHSKFAEFNHIFYPGSPSSKSRALPSLHAGYQLQVDRFDFSIGAGYGHRAPSVSEGYGYYIYNSFDRYDYIGNPDLPNEVSYEANARARYKDTRLEIDAKLNYFHIQNYIVGKILNMGSPMNYQSVGVKGYTALEYATLVNTSLAARYDILQHLHWGGMLTYARALDDQRENLPFIRPLSYQSELHYMYANYGFRTSVNGDFAQDHHSPFYGEDFTPAFTVLNISADYTHSFKGYQAVLQVGAENLFNSYYITYADWGNIPRMGRNIFTSITVNF